MRPAALFVLLVLIVPGLAADSHHVEVDEKADFSTFKTFVVREGRATSRKAEIKNTLTLKTIENAIRTGLSARGLTEIQDRADLIVTFSVAEEPQRVVTGRGIRDMQAVSHSVGTLVIDMTKAGTTSVVWHGTYLDDEVNASNLAKNLPKDAKKLLAEFPPKRKR